MSPFPGRQKLLDGLYEHIASTDGKWIVVAVRKCILMDSCYGESRERRFAPIPLKSWPGASVSISNSLAFLRFRQFQSDGGLGHRVRARRLPSEELIGCTPRNQRVQCEEMDFAAFFEALHAH